MRAYIIITGIIFALITIAHLARLALESTRVLTEPVYVVFTILSAAIAIWAIVLLRRLHR
jgi:hypothetical protein